MVSHLTRGGVTAAWFVQSIVHLCTVRTALGFPVRMRALKLIWSDPCVLAAFTNTIRLEATCNSFIRVRHDTACLLSRRLVLYCSSCKAFGHVQAVPPCCMEPCGGTPILGFASENGHPRLNIFGSAFSLKSFHLEAPASAKGSKPCQES